MSDVQTHTVQAAADTGGGNQDITSVALGSTVPKGVWLTISSGITNGTEAAHGVLSHGAVDSAGNQFFSLVGSEDNVVGTQHERIGATNACLCVYTQNVQRARAGFVQWIAGGIRINWSVTPPEGYLIMVTFFAGADINTKANIAPDAVNLNQEVVVSDVGFEPNVILAVSHSDPFDNNEDGFHQRSLGFATNDGAGGVFQSIWGAAISTGNVQAGQLSTTYIQGGYNTNGTFAWAVEIGNFTANGFSVWRRIGQGSNNAIFAYLAIGLPSDVAAYGAVIDTPLTTGAQTYTGVGFKPQHLMLVSGHYSAINTAQTGGFSGSRGIASGDPGTQQFHACYRNVGSVSPTNCKSLTDNKILNLPSDDGTQLLVATLDSFDADGFTLNYASTDTGTVRKLQALAIQEAEVSPPADIRFPVFSRDGIHSAGGRIVQ